MLVQVHIVKPVGRVGRVNPADFFDLRGIGETRDVEDHRAQIRIGAALAELEAVHQVITPVQLEILGSHPTEPLFRQLGVRDLPRKNGSRLRGILDLGDGEAGFIGQDAGTGQVDVRARQFLLDLDIHRLHEPAHRDVREQMDIRAPSRLYSRQRPRKLGRLRARIRHEGRCEPDGQNGDTSSTHRNLPHGVSSPSAAWARLRGRCPNLGRWRRWACPIDARSNRRSRPS